MQRIILCTAAYTAENFPINTAVKLNPKNSKNIEALIGAPTLKSSFMYSFPLLKAVLNNGIQYKTINTAESIFDNNVAYDKPTSPIPSVLKENILIPKVKAISKTKFINTITSITMFAIITFS